jgi:hypothetical protein
MPTASNTSPDAHQTTAPQNPPQPTTPPNTPKPPTQQGSAPQRVNGNVESRGQAEISAGPGSQNDAASNGASMPSYSLADLVRGLNAAHAAQSDPTVNDTHTKN